MSDTTSMAGCDLHDVYAPSESPVLNPYLYDRLRERFGSVLVAKDGEQSSGHYVHEGQELRYKFIHAGEYYRICCPFCRQKGAVDTRHRLWIQHRWGVGLDPEDADNQGDRFWWACVCYNENCLEDPANRRQLRNWLYDGVGRERHAPAVRVLRTTSAPAASLGIVQLPGRCVRIDQLPEAHQARQYLLSRGLNPEIVGPRYGVTYCQEGSADFAYVTGRLVIPIMMQGQLVSWQARPTYDTDWKAAGLPKYYNAPGTNASLALYGFDEAKHTPWCVVVEGVSDVWRVGPGAVALLGKSMSSQQAELIVANWRAVVLALDADAGPASIQRVRMLLGNSIPTVVVVMPAGLDPASIEQEYFFDLIYDASLAQGVDLLSL